MDEQENLNELFKLPIGLQPVAQLDDKILYGSKALRQSFLEAIQGTSVINNSSIIESLVNEGKIVPCFTTGGLASFFLWKIFAPVHLKSVVGFYSRETKKVYVLLSNNFSFFAYASNDWLAKLVIHECMHMVSHMKSSYFLGDFSDILNKYYKYYFEKVLCDINEKEITNFIEFIFNDFENKIPQGNILKEYKTYIQKISPKAKEEKINKLITIIAVYFNHFDKFFSVRGQFSDILYPLYNSYKNALNIKNLSTVCIQELFYPSEVVAIASEYSQYTSKVLTALKRLA